MAKRDDSTPAVLPDLLVAGLDVVFCGSAVGAVSARLGAYYAGPGNRFWPTLHAVGLTDRVLAPREYALALSYGIGLTDLNKTQSGADRDLSVAADDPAALRAKVAQNRPAFLAFVGKRPAQAFYDRPVAYGRQPEPLGDTAVYVLPSPSGLATAFWDMGPWQELAEHIRQRRLFSAPEPDLSRLTEGGKEDMRVGLNRRLYHRIGLDLRKKRDESEFSSRVTSPALVARQRALVTQAAAGFLAREPWLPQPDATTLAAVVANFFALYPARPVPDNEGGTKFGDSFWIYALTRLLSPAFIVESGVHRGHSAWLLRQAAPAAEQHGFDVSFRNLAWRDPRVSWHEQDWMQAPLYAPHPDRALAYFDDHISHAQRIVEAHGRGFRTLLFDDDFPAHQLHATGHPPAPTLAMIFDSALRDGDELAWLRHGVEKKLRFDGRAAADARTRIAHYARTPDLGPLLRLRPQSGIAVVRLKPPA